MIFWEVSAIFGEGYKQKNIQLSIMLVVFADVNFDLYIIHLPWGYLWSRQIFSRGGWGGGGGGIYGPDR